MQRVMSMLISFQKQFIFIHVYKVAGTSVKNALFEYSSYAEKNLYHKTRRKLHDLGIITNYKYSTFRYHATALQIKSRLPMDIWNTFFKFAFVRNPWDWWVSQYHHQLRDEREAYYNIVNNMSFNEYLNWRLSKEGAGSDQKRFVVDENGKLIVDFLGRYETLDRDFNLICRHLGINKKLGRFNAGSHRNYREYYNEELRQLVETRCRPDIEFLGYKF